jgi:hypothetical protein
MIKRPIYTVTVGNQVKYQNHRRQQANAIYATFRRLSMSAYGIYSGETVTLAVDGKVIQKHTRQG